MYFVEEQLNLYSYSVGRSDCSFCHRCSWIGGCNYGRRGRRCGLGAARGLAGALQSAHALHILAHQAAHLAVVRSHVEGLAEAVEVLSPVREVDVLEVRSAVELSTPPLGQGPRLPQTTSSGFCSPCRLVVRGGTCRGRL